MSFAQRVELLLKKVNRCDVEVATLETSICPLILFTGKKNCVMVTLDDMIKTDKQIMQDILNPMLEILK